MARHRMTIAIRKSWWSCGCANGSVAMPYCRTGSFGCRNLLPLKNPWSYSHFRSGRVYGNFPSSPGMSSVSGRWLHLISLRGMLAWITESILDGVHPCIRRTTRATQYSELSLRVSGKAVSVAAAWMRGCDVVLTVSCGMVICRCGLPVYYVSLANRLTPASHIGVFRASSRASCGVEATTKVAMCSWLRKFSFIPFSRKDISPS